MSDEKTRRMRAVIDLLASENHRLNEQSWMIRMKEHKDTVEIHRRCRFPGDELIFPTGPDEDDVVVVNSCWAVYIGHINENTYSTRERFGNTTTTKKFVIENFGENAWPDNEKMIKFVYLMPVNYSQHLKSFKGLDFYRDEYIGVVFKSDKFYSNFRDSEIQFNYCHKLPLLIHEGLNLVARIKQHLDLEVNVITFDESDESGDEWPMEEAILVD